MRPMDVGPNGAQTSTGRPEPTGRVGGGPAVTSFALGRATIAIGVLRHPLGFLSSDVPARIPKPGLRKGGGVQYLTHRACKLRAQSHALTSSGQSQLETVRGQYVKTRICDRLSRVQFPRLPNGARLGGGSEAAPMWGAGPDRLEGRGGRNGAACRAVSGPRGAEGIP